MQGKQFYKKPFYIEPPCRTYGTCTTKDNITKELFDILFLSLQTMENFEAELAYIVSNPFSKCLI